MNDITIMSESKFYLILIGIWNMVVGGLVFYGMDIPQLGPSENGSFFVFLGAIYIIIGMLRYMWLHFFSILFILFDLSYTHIIVNQGSMNPITVILLIAGSVILCKIINYKWNN